MPNRKRWLTVEEWSRFEELFDMVEGTNYYDVRELALMLVAQKYSELAQRIREGNENISTVLMLGLLVKKEAAK